MLRDQTGFDKLLGAYKRVAAELKYRPGHFGDGLGGCSLTEEQVADPQLLHGEAANYVSNFIDQEDKCTFLIGCADYRTLEAFYYIILAAETMCSGPINARRLGLPLLKMAIKALPKVSDATR